MNPAAQCKCDDVKATAERCVSPKAKLPVIEAEIGQHNRIGPFE